MCKDVSLNFTRKMWMCDSHRGINYAVKYSNTYVYNFENLNHMLCDVLFIFQISIPMSVEFEELAKLRDNPSDEQASKYSFIYYYQKYCISLDMFEQLSIHIKLVTDLESRKTSSFVTATCSGITE